MISICFIAISMDFHGDFLGGKMCVYISLTGCFGTVFFLHHFVFVTKAKNKEGHNLKTKSSTDASTTIPRAAAGCRSRDWPCPQRPLSGGHGTRRRGHGGPRPRLTLNQAARRTCRPASWTEGRNCAGSRTLGHLEKITIPTLAFWIGPICNLNPVTP